MMGGPGRRQIALAVYEEEILSFMSDAEEFHEEYDFSIRGFGFYLKRSLFRVEEALERLHEKGQVNTYKDARGHRRWTLTGKGRTRGNRILNSGKELKWRKTR